MIKADIRSEDPREALLKYASKEGDKKWTAGSCNVLSYRLGNLLTRSVCFAIAWGKDQKT